MGDDGFLIELALVVLLILLNGFFAATEIAVVSARRSRLQSRAEQGERKALAALRLKDDMDRFLATVQIGVTVVSTLASAVGGVAAIERLEPLIASLAVPWAAAVAEPVAVALVVAGIAYLSLVIGELVPKGLAVRHAEGWAVRVAPTIEAISRITRPVVTFLTASSRVCLRLLGRQDPDYKPFHTLEDLRAIAEEAQQQGVVQGDLVTGAVEFHERQVREVVTPPPRVVALTMRTTVEEALRVVRESGHSRFPLRGESTDDIVGFVYARDIYEVALHRTSFDLPKLVRNALVVPESKAATALLADMRRSGVPMAIAIDEHGVFAGLVTVEDLVEVIVGEIRDEHPGARDLVEVLPAGALEAEGTVPVHVLNDDYGVRLPESSQYVSIAGLVLDRLGALPRVGDRVRVPPYRVTVLHMDGVRVARIRIERQDPEVTASE